MTALLVQRVTIVMELTTLDPQDHVPRVIIVQMVVVVLPNSYVNQQCIALAGVTPQNPVQMELILVGIGQPCVVNVRKAFTVRQSL